MGGLLYAASP
jgi:hypothetical protein